MTGDQWRARFDAQVAFTNGGGLTANGFVLDIPGDDIDERSIGELLVRHLGLLMVGEVRVTGLEVFAEAHKGSRGVPRPSRRTGRRVIELSHPISDGMITYPGLPAPSVSDHLTFTDSASHYGPGTAFQIARIDMVANTGTYLDSPFHRYADGDDIAGLPLDRLVDLDGVVVRTDGSERRAIDRATLLPHAVAGRAVLIHTGWDRHWAPSDTVTGIRS